MYNIQAFNSWKTQSHVTNHVISTVYYFMCVMLTSDVNCLFTPRSEENNGKKTGIIDQPRFHADMQNTSQKCPLISSLTPLFDSTNYLALFRSYQRAIIHCQTFSVARGERNAHFLVLTPRLHVANYHMRLQWRRNRPETTTWSAYASHVIKLNICHPICWGGPHNCKSGHFMIFLVQFGINKHL